MNKRKEDLIYVGIDLHKDSHTAVILDCWNTKLGKLPSPIHQLNFLS
ncbi:hypothetical protein [Anaerotignum propionicum]|jgi:hypothetical protein|nr:hypothetical protein [Anaerotignum propionicum]